MHTSCCQYRLSWWDAIPLIGLETDSLSGTDKAVLWWFVKHTRHTVWKSCCLPCSSRTWSMFTSVLIKTSPVNTLVIESMDYSLCFTAGCKWEIFSKRNQYCISIFIHTGAYFPFIWSQYVITVMVKMMAVRWLHLTPIHLHLLPLIMVGHVLNEVLGYTLASILKTALWQRRDCSLWKTVSVKAVFSTKQCKCKHFIWEYFISMFMNISYILSSLWA